jgi:hypothetical protein
MIASLSYVDAANVTASRPILKNGRCYKENNYWRSNPHFIFIKPASNELFLVNLINGKFSILQHEVHARKTKTKE